MPRNFTIGEKVWVVMHDVFGAEVMELVGENVRLLVTLEKGRTELVTLHDSHVYRNKSCAYDELISLQELRIAKALEEVAELRKKMGRLVSLQKYLRTPSPYVDPRGGEDPMWDEENEYST